MKNAALDSYDAMIDGLNANNYARFEYGGEVFVVDWNHIALYTQTTDPHCEIKLKYVLCHGHRLGSEEHRLWMMRACIALVRRRDAILLAEKGLVK